jgi:hypothetical protein
LFNFSVGLIKKIDKNHKTSSKYTIMMYGVEKRNQNQEYIQTYINQFLISNNKDQVQVVKINVSSSDCRQHNLEKVAEELEVTLKRLHLYAEQHKSEEHKRLMLQEKIEEVQKKKDEVNKEITELKRENDTEQKPAEEEGVAFVTLQKQSEMRRLARFDSFSRAFQYGWAKLFSKPKPSDPNHPTMGVHYIKRACEPKDLVWENLNVGPVRRFIFKCLSLSLAFLFIGGSIYLQSVIFRYAADLENSGFTGFTQSMLRRVVELAVALVIQVSNVIVEIALVYLSDMELPESVSTKIHSLTTKLSFFQTFNTFFYPYFKFKLTQDQPEHIFLTQTLFMGELYSILLTPIFNNLSIGHLFSTCKRKIIISKIKEDKCYNITQRDFNKMYEPQELEIYMLYAGMFRTFFFGLFMLYHIPAINFLSSISLTVQYFVYRSRIIHASKKLPALNPSFSLDMIRFTTFSLFFAAYGLDFPGSKYEKYLYAVLCATLVIIWWLYWFSDDNKEKDIEDSDSTAHASDDIIQQELNVCDEEVEETYEEACLYFETDYDRTNPVSTRSATSEWIRRVSSVGLKDE